MVSHFAAVYGNANVRTFSGQTYVQRGAAGQQLNVGSRLGGWSSGAYLSGGLPLPAAP